MIKHGLYDDLRMVIIYTFMVWCHCLGFWSLPFFGMVSAEHMASDAMTRHVSLAFKVGGLR